MVPSRYILTPLVVFFVMKTLGDECYVIIKAYKLTVFDILRDFFVLPYIACPRYPYIRVYRLYDSVETPPDGGVMSPFVLPLSAITRVHNPTHGQCSSQERPVKILSTS